MSIISPLTVPLFSISAELDFNMDKPLATRFCQIASDLSIAMLD